MTVWTAGNELSLLENGEAFFPRVCEAIRGARREILLETFIWSEDRVGHELGQALIDAAQRGVRVRATADGFGCAGFSSEFLERLNRAGVQVDSFDPKPSVLGFRTNLLCRLHRKIVIVDRHIAFVGGINFGDVHLRDLGEDSKQDYAVEVTGPVVAEIHRYCREWYRAPTGGKRHVWRHWLRSGRIPRDDLRPAEDAQARLVIRDNAWHRTDIETFYRAGFRHAKRRIIIANAYFFPGSRFIRSLVSAARRGVDVQLIVQGKPDRPLTVGAASLVYGDLLAAGVKIFEYRERALHAKVAVIDDDWATVGSSNLDPVSLGLNLEANLFIRDRRFNAELAGSLARLLDESCEAVPTTKWPRVSWWRRLALAAAYHATRRLTAWARLVARETQAVRPMRAGTGLTAEPTDRPRPQRA